MRKEETQETRIEEAGASGALTEGGWSAERHCEEQSNEEPVMPTSHQAFNNIFMPLGHMAHLAIRQARVPGVESRSTLESGIWEGMSCNLHLVHLLVRINKP